MISCHSLKFWKNKNASSVVYPGAIFVIGTLLIYQFIYGTSISNSSKITPTYQFILDSILTDDNSTISNEIAYENKTEARLIIIEQAKLENHSFSSNKIWFQEKLAHTEDLPLTEYTAEPKKVLVWNKVFSGSLDFFKAGPTWFRDNGCPVWQCEIWSDWNSSSSIPVEDFDAVLFHDPTWLKPYNNSNVKPPKRSPHQRYVFWNREPPGLHTYLKLWDESANFFNWTFTYRWDSEIIIPYGYFRPITDNEIRNHKVVKKKNYAEGRTKMVVWFVSNCGAKNGRLDYAHRLQRHVPVDIYGRCGNLTCGHDKQHECRNMMSRDYKFVIAFENSMCWDYITEKFFMNLQFNIIPIVLDLHGNYARMAPANSYINALDFPSVKHLADYLKVLDKDDAKYNEYFWWKEYYINEHSLHHHCAICSKLHNPSEPVTIYKNLTRWWHHDASCKVLKFPESIENDTWIAKDYNPPYDVY